MTGDLHRQPHDGGRKDQVVFILAADRSLRISTAFALEVEGATVRSFASPEECMTAIRARGGRTCLLIDHDPPGLDAAETAKALRDAGLEVTVIVMASAPSRPFRFRLRTLGAELIEKPLLCDAVMKALESACRKSRAGENSGT